MFLQNEAFSWQLKASWWTMSLVDNLSLITFLIYKQLKLAKPKLSLKGIFTNFGSPQ